MLCKDEKSFFIIGLTPVQFTTLAPHNNGRQEQIARTYPMSNVNKLF